MGCKEWDITEWLSTDISYFKSRKSIISASYLTTQHRQLTFLQLSKLGVSQLSQWHWVSGYALVYFNWPLTVSFNWDGAGNLLHCQIKLRISTNTGDPRTRRHLPRFICTPWEGGWAQGAAAVTNWLLRVGEGGKSTLRHFISCHNCWL